MKRQRVLECSSPKQRREVCSSVRGTKEVATVQDGTERFVTVREAQSCCSSAEAAEGAQDSSRESFNIKRVSSLTRR